MRPCDPSLDTLLDLDGQVLVIDEGGYWAKFVVHLVPVTTGKPRGLDYTLTMGSPDGGRLVAFDNAHPLAAVGLGHRQGPQPQAPAADGQGLWLHGCRRAAGGVLERS